jgi:cytochrome c oxidase assembly protein subunit 15
MNLALAHQAVAIAVLTLAVLQAERLTRRQPGLAPIAVRPAAQAG